MANPQKENGYTAISNELYEALCHIRIPGEAEQCLKAIIRKTYGFNKKEDAISLSQFCEITGLRKTNVCRSLVKLTEMRLIVIKKDNKEHNGHNDTTKYSLNKNYDEWKPLSKKITLSKKIINVIKKDNLGGLNKETHKRQIPKVDKSNIAETSSALSIEGKKKEKKPDPKLDTRPFILEEFLVAMRSSKQRYINIIGEYADQIKPNFTTRGQWHVFTNRNLRAAQDLSPFTDEQIGNAFIKIKQNLKSQSNPKGYITKWGLETLLAYIHEK